MSYWLISATLRKVKYLCYWEENQNSDRINIVFKFKEIAVNDTVCVILNQSNKLCVEILFKLF